jgi:hypothetical protein
MSAIAYTVIATFPDRQTADEYIAWLEDGHVDQVIEHGAHTAMIVRVSDPATPIQVECRYIFSTRQAFDRYVSEYAPALRAEGLERFPPQRQVRFERRVGEVI